VWCVYFDVFGATNVALIDYAILAALITALVVVAVAVAGSWIFSMWTHLLPILW
jgi:Flp pilus assembly pilin Flp